jgi:hypothetical protein
MIWLSWRQHRQQVLAGAIGLALLASWLFVSHLGIARMWGTTGLASCFASPGRDCSGVSDVFNTHYQGLRFLIPLFLIAPLLIGLFWGAPLVARELEHGTQRLIWTQSVTRRRWFSTKLALVGGGVVVGMAALAALVTWWTSMFVRAGNVRLTPGVFDIRGIVPIAYGLFALGLGVLAGTLIRKTIPAMAATLGGFVAVRAIVTLMARRHFFAPKTISQPMLGPQGPIGSGDWVLSTETVDRTGHVVSALGRGFDLNYLGPRCQGLIPPPPNLPTKGNLAACVNRLGLHAVTTYQPGSRFWAFQGIEFAIYAALAAGLLLVAAWVVRRRLA